MQALRLALVQFAPRLGEVGDNLDRIVEFCGRCRKERADLAVFPELALTGYHLEDQVPDVAIRLDGPEMRRLLRASRTLDVVVGLVEEAPGHVYHNAAAYLSRGRIVHVHRKIHLPTYGMFQEGRDFAPGDRVRAFETSHGPTGMLVCEDAWHPMLAWLLAQQGAEIVHVLSSGPTRGARPGRGITSVAVWHDLLRATAQFQTSFLVYVNRVGWEDGLNFGGGSQVIDPFGRIVAALPALETGVAIAELDPSVLRRARTAYPLLRDENLELILRELGRLRALRFDLPDPEPPGATKGGRKR